MAEHDINCQCEACRFAFAEADDFAAQVFKSIPTCKREGCAHNNCLFDAEGKCAGTCACAAAEPDRAESSTRWFMPGPSIWRPRGRI